MGARGWAEWENNECAVSDREYSVMKHEAASVQRQQQARVELCVVESGV